MAKTITTIKVTHLFASRILLVIFKIGIFTSLASCAWLLSKVNSEGPIENEGEYRETLFAGTVDPVFHVNISKYNRSKFAQYREETQPSKFIDEGDKHKYRTTLRSKGNSSHERSSLIDEKGGKSHLTISPGVLNHLRTLPEFPKLVHIIWPDKDVINTKHHMIENGVKKLVDLNPDWSVQVHEYSDIDRMIEKFEHPDFPTQMKADLKSAHIVEKSDSFRLMIIYTVGGLYVDIDRVVSIPLDEVIDVKHNKMVIPTYYDINFAQDLFGSAPGNNLILNILKLQWKKRIGPPPLMRKQGWLKFHDHMKLVNAHSESLENDIFGKRVENWDVARNALKNQSDNLIITKRDVWCDGLLVKPFEGCKKVSRASLYNEYNITHWRSAVDKVWLEN